MANITHKPTLGRLDLNLRTNDETGLELYVIIDGKDYVLNGVFSLDLHKIEIGSVLTADIAAYISKLG